MKDHRKGAFATAIDFLEAAKLQTKHGNGKRPRNLPGKTAAFLSVAVLLTLVSVLLLPPIRRALLVRQLPRQQQIAVIPFTAIDNDVATAALGKGLAETLTARLTRLTLKHSFQVVPVGEVRRSRIESVQQARGEFGINLGIEGSVQRDRSRTRVTYHIVDAKNLQDLYGETLTASNDDLFELEDQVATSMEKALDLQLAPQDRVSYAQPPTLPSAYDFCLQGRGYLQELVRPGSIDSAITVFSRAAEIDPTYAPAYAGLGQAYWYKYEDTRLPDFVVKAREACNKAETLRDDAADGHSCLGVIYAGTNNYQAAAREFARAVDLEPTSDEAIRGWASALAKQGQNAKAEESYQRAIHLRPNYWAGYNMLGVFYFQGGRYADAEKMFRQVLELSPDNYRGPSNLGGLYLLQGQYSLSIPLLEKAVSLRPSADAYSNLGSAYFFTHKYAEAAQAYRRALAINDRNYLWWGNLAEATHQIKAMQPQALGLYKKAIAVAEEQLVITPKDAILLGNLALYHSELGEKEQALSYLRQSLAANENDPYIRFNAAEVFNNCGNVTQALHWLEAALSAGYSKTLARDTPSLAELGKDPRFGRILN